MLKSVEIIVWRLVQSKQKMNSKLIVSAVSGILSFNVFTQWNMHYFSAQLTLLYVFFHLKERTYLTSACSIPSHALWAASSPVAWWCSSSWTCWKRQRLSHQSPCSDPCAPPEPYRWQPWQLQGFGPDRDPGWQLLFCSCLNLFTRILASAEAITLSCLGI